MSLHSVPHILESHPASSLALAMDMSTTHYIRCNSLLTHVVVAIASIGYC
jgi:hypothetical protein